MTKRSNLRPQLKSISKPALKFLWMMIRKRKTSSLSSCRSGCAAVFTEDEHVLIEILARLPAETLMQFQCVCKTWRSLIADPHFVEKHINYDAGRALTDADLRLLYSMKPPRSMALADLKGAEVGERLRDDLVAVREVEFPVNLDFVKRNEILIVGGFGFDEINDDYMGDDYFW